VGLNNIGKDRVSCDVEKFEPFLGKEIKRVDITKEKWLEAFYHVMATVMKDLPRSWSTVSYYLVSNAIKPRKVLFTGEAADELFGGYKDYLKPGTTKYSKYTRRDIFDEMPNEFKPEISADPFLTDVINHIPVGCYAADTGAAINGVETRNPFLRFDIVRFALSIPTEYKIRNGTTKYLLRKLFEQKFSKELVYEKQGFSAFPEDAYKVPKHMEEFKKIIGFKGNPKGDDKWKLACGAMLYETI
jgi:asparagine synthetase B (glutamine-hydrolysing)